MNRIKNRLVCVTTLSLLMSFSAPVSWADTLFIGALGGVGFNKFSAVPDVGFERSAALLGGVEAGFELVSPVLLFGDLLVSPYQGEYNQSIGGIGINLTQNVTYLDLVLGARLKPLGRLLVAPYIEGGPVFGNKLSESVSLKIDGKEIVDSGTSSFTGTHFAAMGGAGVELNLMALSARLGARYVHGLSDVVDSNSVEMKIRSLQILVGIDFGIL